MKNNIKVLEDFVEPIVRRAIERADEEGKPLPVSAGEPKLEAGISSGVEEDQSLLDYLIQYTRGKSSIIFHVETRRITAVLRSRRSTQRDSGRRHVRPGAAKMLTRFAELTPGRKRHGRLHALRVNYRYFLRQTLLTDGMPVDLHHLRVDSISTRFLAPPKRNT